MSVLGFITLSGYTTQAQSKLSRLGLNERSLHHSTLPTYKNLPICRAQSDRVPSDTPTLIRSWQCTRGLSHSSSRHLVWPPYPQPQDVIGVGGEGINNSFDDVCLETSNNFWNKRWQDHNISLLGFTSNAFKIVCLKEASHADNTYIKEKSFICGRKNKETTWKSLMYPRW